MFACSISSAVKLYLYRDYSEEGFLQTWRQHVCDWGEPSLVYSDRGNQLVGAAGGLDPKDMLNSRPVELLLGGILKKWWSPRD